MEHFWFACVARSAVCMSFLCRILVFIGCLWCIPGLGSSVSGVCDVL